MMYVTRIVAALGVAVVTLTGCTSTHISAQSARVVVSSATPTSSPTTSVATRRVVRVGQAWDAPGWRITVVGVAYERGDPIYVEDPANDVCVLNLRYTNTGTAPVAFSGTSDGTAVDPTRDAAGYDASGARYEGTGFMRDATNPGASDSTQLRFEVAHGVKLTRVDVGDVSVVLS